MFDSLLINTELQWSTCIKFYLQEMYNNSLDVDVVLQHARQFIKNRNTDLICMNERSYFVGYP